VQTEFVRHRLGRVAGILHLWPVLRIPRRLNERVPHRAVSAVAPRLAAYCVYRARNASTVRRFVDELPVDAAVHLHALDAVAPALQAWTRSSGPGWRMSLLQALIDTDAPGEDAYVCIFDDDVVFTRHSAGRFAALAVAAGFDIAQPAHGIRSSRSFHFNKVGWLSTARRTRMVEVGPVVLLSPRAQAAVLPFDRDAGMGYGLDVRWSSLRGHGLTLGVVDATPVMHLGAVGADYALPDELALLDAALQEQGLSSVYDLDVPLEGPRWRPWQPLPPWRA
jgi:hypothetical protein